MHMKIATPCLVALAFAWLAGVANAGLLASDPNALPGFHGTSAFIGSSGSFTLHADVDYAVYAPGAFGTDAALGLPAAADPSFGTEFVYAYQIFNDGPAGSTLALNLSVALIPGAIPIGSNRITDAPGTPAGGIPPNSDLFIPGTDPEHNAKWAYNSGLPLGSISDILLFTSPLPPTFETSGMQGGHTTIAMASLPSPVPEPATLVLCAFGAVCVLVARSLRKQVA
jgi:hypothetical protein